MKLLSQLTRQAMNRHRILSSDAVFSLSTHSVPESVFTFSPPAAPQTPPSPPDSPSPPPPRTLYPNTPPPEPAVLSTAPGPRERPLTSASQPPRPRTIYQQLMSSHDRMTQRHL